MYEDTEFTHEIKAFERVGGGILGTKIKVSKLYGKKLNEINKILKTLNIPPEEKLTIAVDAVARKYMDIFNFGQGNIEDMISNIYRLDKPGAINALGYVLGYSAARMIGVTNTIKKVEINNIKDSNLKIPDIIRYFHLWENLQ